MLKKINILIIYAFSFKCISMEPVQPYGNINVGLSFNINKINDIKSKYTKKTVTEDHYDQYSWVKEKIEECPKDFLYCKKNTAVLTSRDSYVGLKGGVPVFANSTGFYRVNFRTNDIVNIYEVTENAASKDAGVSLREGLIGISGDLGTLKLGRIQNVIGESSSGFDLFDGTEIAIYKIAEGNNRHKSTISYISPEFLYIRLHLSTSMPQEKNFYRRIYNAEKEWKIPASFQISYGDIKLIDDFIYAAVGFEKGFPYNSESAVDYINPYGISSKESSVDISSNISNTLKEHKEKQQELNSNAEDSNKANQVDATDQTDPTDPTDPTDQDQPLEDHEIFKNQFYQNWTIFNSYMGNIKKYLIRGLFRCKIEKATLGAVVQFETYYNRGDLSKYAKDINLNVLFEPKNRLIMAISGKYEFNNIIGLTQIFADTNKNYGFGAGAQIKIQANTYIYADAVYRGYSANYNFTEEQAEKNQIFNGSSFTISAGLSHKI